MGQRRVYRRQRRRMRQRHGRLQKEKHKFFSVIRDLRLDSIRCWAFVCSSGSVNDSVTREYERFRARYIYSYLCYPYFIILSFRPLYLLDSYIYLLLGSSSIYISLRTGTSIYIYRPMTNVASTLHFIVPFFN